MQGFYFGIRHYLAYFLRQGTPFKRSVVQSRGSVPHISDGLLTTCERSIRQGTVASLCARPGLRSRHKAHALYAPRAQHDHISTPCPRHVLRAQHYYKHGYQHDHISTPCTRHALCDQHYYQHGHQHDQISTPCPRHVLRDQHDHISAAVS